MYGLHKNSICYPKIDGEKLLLLFARYYLDDDDDDEHDDDDHGTIHVPLYVCTTYLFIILYFIMGF